jgi:hypothetical protein
MKRYIITSASPGCKPSEAFLKAIKTYCKLNKAKHLIIPTQGLYKEDQLDNEVYQYGEVLQVDRVLNSNLIISLLPINPEQIDPITGLDRLTNNKSSAIYGSPKQRMKSVASPSNDYPRVLMTPGSCTRPYKKNSKRCIIAQQDHLIGGIVVEIEDNKVYHFRQVQASQDGSFIDLGIKYSNNGKKSRAETAAIIPGDWHNGYTDPHARANVIEMCQQLKPKHLVLHDFFDGISVNHHIDQKFLTRALLKDQNNLVKELQLGSNELKYLSSLVEKVIIVKSNHDEFLDRWLDAGHYVQDKENHIIGLELALAKANGQDPLEYGLNKYANLNNIKFLKTDESFKIRDIECGQHGHLGPNGSRGSSISLERSYGKSVTGHSHSPEIQRGCFVMGTTSYLKLNYNKGPSSWMQSACVVYSNGNRQLINTINKKWKA